MRGWRKGGRGVYLVMIVSPGHFSAEYVWSVEHVWSVEYVCVINEERREGEGDE